MAVMQTGYIIKYLWTFQLVMPRSIFIFLVHFTSCTPAEKSIIVKYTFISFKRCQILTFFLLTLNVFVCNIHVRNVN